MVAYDLVVSPNILKLLIKSQFGFKESILKDFVITHLPSEAFKTVSDVLNISALELYKALNKNL